MESIKKLSNFNFQWAKNLVQEQYQNNFIYLFLIFIPAACLQHLCQ